LKFLIDFFALRPVITLYGLKIVWFIFLLNLAIQIFSLAVGTYAAYGRLNIGQWLEFIPLLFSPLVQIALVRVLLEVAATILLRREPVLDSN
jgi:hypothetical protein